jgi:hypothetical protein
VEIGYDGDREAVERLGPALQGNVDAAQLQAGGLEERPGG